MLLVTLLESLAILPAALDLALTSGEVFDLGESGCEFGLI